MRTLIRFMGQPFSQTFFLLPFFLILFPYAVDIVAYKTDNTECLSYISVLKDGVIVCECRNTCLLISFLRIWQYIEILNIYFDKLTPRRMVF